MSDNNQSNNQPPVRDLEQELLQKKTEDFEKELAALSSRYNLVLVPVQKVTMLGTSLDIVFMPKDEYERQAGRPAQAPEKGQPVG